MILIVTNKMDSHADAVIRNLRTRDVEVFRLNTEDLFTRYTIDMGIGKLGGWHGSIRDEVGRTLDLADVRVGWLRRPSFDFSCGSDLATDHAANPSLIEFIAAEGQAFVHTLYALPNITWINNPFSSSRTKVKFQQLILASQLGVTVPRTCITNQVETARAFFDESPGDVLVKGIYTGSFKANGIERGVPSAKVEREHFEQRCELLSLCATQFQDYIEKDFELRVTIIGTKVFATKIESQVNEETKVDWRLRTELNPHTSFDLPDSIAKFCTKFLEIQGALYGAMDFIVTPSGEYVFLENNPYGQYLWLELETGIQMTDELCNLLIQLDGTTSLPVVES